MSRPDYDIPSFVFCSRKPHLNRDGRWPKGALIKAACLYNPDTKMIIANHGSAEAFVLVDSFNWGVSTKPANFKTNDFVVGPHAPLVVEGLFTSLADPWSFNYYHWCEELARAVWIETTGLRPSYTVPNDGPLYSDTLRYFGVEESRAIAFRGAPITCSEYLVLPQVYLNEPIAAPFARLLRDSVRDSSEPSNKQLQA